MTNGFPGKLSIVDDNNNETELQVCLEYIPDIDADEDVKHFCINNEMTKSMDFTIDNINHLSRKKFIKLLMSKGIGRNGANEIAKYVLNKNGRYTMLDLMMW